MTSTSLISSSETEIGHENVDAARLPLIDEDIVGFEIAMDQSCLMGGRKPTGGEQVMRDGLTPVSALARTPLSQGSSPRVAHRDEHVVSLRSYVEHRQYVGMSYASHRLGLAYESRSDQTCEVIDAKAFDDEFSVKLWIASQIRLAHPSPAK